MKIKKIILYIFMYLPLATVFIVLPFLPDTIPAHYNFHGEITRWGSKYESLIFPVFTIFFGFFMLGVARYCAKKEEDGKNNENICLITGIGCLILFNALTGYSLYTDFTKIENLSLAAVDINQITCGILGLLMMIIGNIMPKARLNSILGVRTTWSMKNEWTWKKSQRFGGILFMVAGVFIFAVSCLTKGMTCFLWVMGILAVVTIISVYYTYYIYKKSLN